MTPDLAGSEHGVDCTRQLTRRSDAGDAPLVAFLHEGLASTTTSSGSKG
jgi:hypothetical protein